MSAPRVTPEGLTLREEGFAQSVASGLSQFAAYRANYNVASDTPRSTVDQNASHLATKLRARIHAIIAASQAATAHKNAWTMERMVQQAETHMEVALRDHARRGPNVSAANGALEIIGRATGLLSEKPQQIQQPITRVVVVLDHGRDAEGQPRVVEAEYKVLGRALGTELPDDNVTLGEETPRIEL